LATRFSEPVAFLRAASGQDDQVLIVLATKGLLQRLGPPTLQQGEHSTTLLGEWYATALFWKPRVVLLVNEGTLLPVLMPPAPVRTAPARIGRQIAAVLAAHRTPTAIIDAERQQMRHCRISTTANRSVVGVMTEFTRLAEVYRGAGTSQDLLDLAIRLATTPCSPLYDKNISPGRELQALLRSIAN
jgi:hypothetical protein